MPYSDVRVSRTWLFIRDYGIGCLGGAWGIHDLDAAQFFLDTDDTTPIEIEGRARYYEDIRDVPYSWTVEQKYANGATVIHMDLVTAKKRAKQFELGGMASLVTGSKGWIWVSRQGVRTEPESLAQTVIGPNEKRVLFSDDHKQNFLDAIRKRAQPISPITAAVHAETMCQQSDIAMQLQRKLRWDPKAEAIHQRRAGQPHALPRHSRALELHDMKLRVCSHVTAAVAYAAASREPAQRRQPASQTQAPTAAPAQEPRRARSHARGTRENRGGPARRKRPRLPRSRASSWSSTAGCTSATAATPRFPTPTSRCS